MKSHLPIIAMLGALWLPSAGADELLGSDLKGLLEYAREHNPELAATRHEADAAQQRSESADALPDPVLRTELIEVGSALMFLVIGQNGRVDKAMLDRPEDVDPDGLAKLERKLASGFRGKGVAEARAEALKRAATARGPERAVLIAAADAFGVADRLRVRYTASMNMLVVQEPVFDP